MKIPEGAEVVYKNPIFTVSTRAEGAIENFGQVHHPGAVAIFAHDNKSFYLTRQYRPAVGRKLLELPAGTREDGEAPEITAERELTEEIGKYPTSMHLLASFYSSPGYSDEKILLYRAWDLEDVEKPPADDSGTIEVVKFPWDLEGVNRALRLSDTAKTHIALLIVLAEMGERV